MAHARKQDERSIAPVGPAALAGLPEFPEIQRTQRRPPDGLNRNRER
jgi:hypothetical protein